MTEEEYAREQAFEEYLFNMLCDDPHGEIVWLLDQVGDEKRSKIIEEISSALAFFQPEPHFRPTPDAMSVLQELAKAKTTLVQVQLEAKLEISRKTIGKILNRLQQVSLIDYQHGLHKGATITSKGRKLLEDSDSL